MKEEGSGTPRDLDIDIDITADSQASVIPPRVGRYEVLREVGRGAMGIVYEARDPLIDRVVALKVIRLDLLEAAGDFDLAKKRFFSEAKAAGKLSHPNIVTVYDVGEDGNTAYIAMEFIPGDNLKKLIDTRSLTLEKTLDITLQICSGLECAHEQGIVHRDIKPSNILITPRGQAKVADFGVARLPASDVTKPGYMVGTPSYMSPEQVSSKQVDGRSDLFSLGVVLYEQLTGERPFKGDDVYTTIMKIMHHDPPPLLEQRRDLPKDLELVIGRALAKSPQERYASASQMAEDITRILHKLSDTEVTLADPAAAARQASVQELIQKRLGIDQELEKLRKDVTVLFAEMAGASEIFAELGELEGRAVIQQLYDQLNGIISSHEGKLIKTLGDGIMATFPGPIQAVEAAVEIQKKLEQRNLQQPGKAPIVPRIGLHHDRALVEESDVHGVVVSAAAHIQDLAQPGQILVSETIHRRLHEEGKALTVFQAARAIPGKKDSIEVYRVIWRPEEVEADVFRSAAARQEAFWLELTRHGSLIRVTTFEDIPGQARTLKHVEEVTLPPEEINQFCTRVVELVGRADRSGRVARSTLKELEELGRLFYDKILPERVRQNLLHTRAESLIVNVDDQLVQIPWELLHDGQQFMCMRFSMGRVVSTRQATAQSDFRPPGDALRMIIFSDPRGDLEAAASEGSLIEEELRNKDPKLHIVRRTGDLTVSQVRSDLGQFHILHYAGHADYDLVDPSLGGWMLKDGKLWSRDIAALAGSGQMPGLVFSNACQSGQTEEWKVDPYHSVRIFGLANAFLLAGVRHYIGTFWDVLDRSSSAFAVEFYAQLAQKKSVGESLREARRQIARKQGEESVVWASYVLYGDPRTRYFGVKEQPEVYRAPAPRREIRWKPIAALAAGVGVVVILTGLLPSLLRQPQVPDRPTSPTAPAAIGTVKPAPVLDSRSAEAEQARRERVDRLVQELARDYREGKMRPLPAPSDGWTSVPLTLALIGLEEQGQAPEVAGETRFMALKLSETLGKSPRVQVVERDILEKLLEELKLSSSELADPSTALRIGKLLSARFILTGYIMRMGDEKQVGIRITETETTAVKGAVSSTIGKEARIVDAVDPLGREILERIRLAYPVKGRIVTAEGVRVEMNIGSREGVTQGMRLIALGPKGEPLGEIEITQATEERSTGQIVKGTGPFYPHGRVEEILPEKPR